jgi:hypothetical protein
VEKISWTDRVRNEEVLHRVKEETNPTCNEKKEGILRRNCRLKHVTEGKLEGPGRRGRRRKHYIALCGELALEKAVDLAYDRRRVMIMLLLYLCYLSQ